MADERQVQVTFTCETAYKAQLLIALNQALHDEIHPDEVAVTVLLPAALQFIKDNVWHSRYNLRDMWDSRELKFMRWFAGVEAEQQAEED